MFEVLSDAAGDAVVWRGDGETLLVQAWGADSVRVRCRLMGDLLDTEYALLPPAPTDAVVEVQGDVAVLRNGRLEVVLRSSSVHDPADPYFDAARCELEFRRPGGPTLFKELGTGGSLRLKARRFEPIPGGDHRLTASFEADPGEKLFGMGQYQQHLLDLKGSTFELAHRNSQASVPFVLSSAGYGFFWHDPSIGRATFGKNRTEWHAASTRQLDYWVTAGDTPAEIVRAYTAATGRPPMMPEYGLGFWQCKLRYWNQEQLLAVAREHTRRGLPLDVIVCDFFHWPRMGDYRFDPEYFPDPAAMVAELRELGVELMVSVWPQVALTSENYREMRDANLLVRAESGVDVQMRFHEPTVFVDATNPAARAYLWEKCRQNYADLGVKVFWLDEAEPEYEVYDYGNYRYHLGPNLQVGNVYPQLFSRAFFEGQVAAGQTDPVNLVRCAWAGSQRYGALVWSGDVSSTWQDFRRQITAGLHMGVAGIGWWTTDIGGFHGGDPADEGFRELLVRWFQWGTFCPVMRLHGNRLPETPLAHPDGRPNCFTGGDNEVWSYGEDVYEILARYVHLRERMRPYVRELMRQAHEDGDPLLRPMFYAYPGDERAWELDDQYMFGDDLLVAPVLELGARRRDVHLPAGSTWTELSTGTTYDGGQTVTVDAPLAVIPVFARDDTLRDLVGTI
ncbi:MAG TPA: glycoside hydrolase family 31 protein [Kineosporiaceae bacterium]|nr:glycoside hydrolase family 31 protein [Kineosporiaceae bacterium]